MIRKYSQAIDLTETGTAAKAKEETRAEKKNLPSLPAQKRKAASSEAPEIVKNVAKALWNTTASVFAPEQKKEEQPPQAAPTRKPVSEAAGRAFRTMMADRSDTELRLKQQAADQAEKEYQSFKENNPIPYEDHGIIPNNPLTATIEGPKQDKESYEYKETQRLRERAETLRQDANRLEDQNNFARYSRKISIMKPEEMEALKTVSNYKGGGTGEAIGFAAYNAAKEALAGAGYSKDEITALVDTYKRIQNERQTQKTQTDAAQFADDHPVLGSLASVGGNIVSGITGTLGVAGEAIGRGLGMGNTYHNLDPNLPGYQPGIYAGAARQTVAQNIEDGFTGKAGSMLYQAAMSGVDNLGRVAFGGGGAMVLAGASAFQSGVRETTMKGGTPMQSYAMGVAQAGLEILTEKVSIDKLLSTPKPKNIIQLLKNAAVQGAVEMTEEEMNFAGTLIADAAVMGKNSDYNRAVQELVASGMPFEQAKRQAQTDVVHQAMETAVQSFLSGSMSSGARGAFQLMAAKAAKSQPSTAVPVEGTQVQHQTISEMAAQDPYRAPTEAAQTADFVPPATDAAPQEIPVQPQQEAQPTQPVQPEATAQPDNIETLKRDIRATFESLKPNNQTDHVGLVDEAVSADDSQVNTNETQNTEGEVYNGREVVDGGDRWVSQIASGEQVAQDSTGSASYDREVHQYGRSSGESGGNVQDRDSEGRTVTPDTHTVVDAPQSEDPIAAAIRATFEKLRANQQPSTDNAYQEQTEESAGYKRSKLYENTYRNTASQTAQSIGEDAKAADPDVDAYEATTEHETVAGAKARVQSAEHVEFEYQNLTTKDGWTAEDSDTAFIVLNALRKSGQTEKFVELARKQRQQATAGGQFVQSFAKYTRTVTGATVEAVDTLNSFKPYDVPKKFYKNIGFEQWQKDTTAAVLDMSNQIEAIVEGDADSMRDMIRTLAAFRRTTAWFGTTSRLTAIADKMVDNLDFETAKDIVTSQLSQIPGDFRHRSTGEVVKSVRIMNMLSSFCTINRNLVGNASISLVDGLSDSTVGAGMDWLVSKATGRREVGNDFVYPKEYINKAFEAAQMAALCTELDIPTDAESKYTEGKTRTFSPRSSIVGRFMSAYEKYLKYGLDVTDKFAEGGTVATVEASLQRLGKSANLTPEEIHKIAQQAAQRRTFKEERMLTRAAKKAKTALNEIGTGNIGVGDFVMPFANVGSNMAHTVIDYSSGGLTGFAEILKLIKDAKDGKTIDPGRQRKVVTDTARGITGMGLVALCTVFASQGIIKVFDDSDKDKRGLEQSEGMTGTQFNVSAALRAMNGENTEWRQTDIVLSMDFLEPFNAQMRIGYLLAQENSVGEMVKSYPKHAAAGIALSLLDMPLMTGVSDLADLGNSFFEATAEGDTSAVVDAAGQALGNVATSFVPALVRQSAQMIDPYYRDTSGDTVAERAKNQFLAQIPFASMSLPKKISGLGEEQRRYAEGDELLGFFNAFFAPGKVTKISPSEISSRLNALSEVTGDNAIYPEYLAPKSITVDGETIVINGKEMTETYQQTYGENISRIYGDLLAKEEFVKLSPDIQTSALKKAKEYATDLAKASISVYTASWMKQIKGDEAEAIMEKIRIASSGLSDAQYATAKKQGISFEEMQSVSKKVRAATKPTSAPTTKYDTFRAVLEHAPADRQIAWLKTYGMTDSQLEKASTSGLPMKDYIDTVDVSNSISSAITNYMDELTAGGHPSAKHLNKAYKAYWELSEEARQHFRDQNGGRVMAFIDAVSNGVRMDHAMDLYSAYRNIDATDLSKSAKANKWAAHLDKDVENGKLTSEQRDIVWESLGYYAQIRQNADKYHDMTAEGLQSDIALAVSRTLAALKPEDGKSSVSAVQKFEAIVGAEMTEEQQITALRAYGNDGQDKNLEEALAMGLIPQQYVSAYRMYLDASGKGKKARTIKQYQDAFGLDYATAKALYEVYA